MNYKKSMYLAFTWNWIMESEENPPVFEIPYSEVQGLIK